MGKSGSGGRTAALSFTLLGAVESLLSAKVADGMIGRKHRYNMEVVEQGVATSLLLYSAGSA
jgi:MFS superfamily sulfate permease-like transporter